MKRKGITPLVGTALLVLIAISAVTSAAVFLRDTTQQVSDSVNERISEDQIRENSGIDIEYAYENSDGNISTDCSSRRDSHFFVSSRFLAHPTVL